jgi:hypothetical protein
LALDYRNRTLTPQAVAARAQDEFDRAVKILSEAGVIVHVFADTSSPEKPDAVFPNNWFSTHHDGRIALYPMYTPSRRTERRLDLIARLGELYRVTDVVDYSPYEARGLYLEGTGSLVLDHVHRLAYVSLSPGRPQPLEQFCADFDYEPLTFEAWAMTADRSITPTSCFVSDRNLPSLSST